MFCAFNRTEQTVVNLDPGEYTGLRTEDIYAAIMRELGPGDWDERDVATAVHRIQVALKETGATP